MRRFLIGGAATLLALASLSATAAAATDPACIRPEGRSAQDRCNRLRREAALQAAGLPSSALGSTPGHVLRGRPNLEPFLPKDVRAIDGDDARFACSEGGVRGGSGLQCSDVGSESEPGRWRVGFAATGAAVGVWKVGADGAPQPWATFDASRPRHVLSASPDALKAAEARGWIRNRRGSMDRVGPGQR